MPAWLLLALQAALGALLQPLLVALINSILSPKIILKIMLLAGKRLVEATSTDLDDEWYAAWAPAVVAELEKELQPKK